MDLSTHDRELLERYDEVPYLSTPFWQSHPDRLATLGIFCGMTPPDTNTCRVLELGSGTGGNLLPMALAAPEATFLGIDLAPNQVESSIETARTVGLTNVEFRVGNILDLGPELGTFDYIVAHGVYSWVPRPVQDQILELCRQLLAPQGLAFVSFNTKPGWSTRSAIRELLLYHTDQFDDPQVKIKESRSLLDIISKDCAAEGDPIWGHLLARELKLIKDHSDSYLYHEHLEADNEPIYLREFFHRAKTAGLTYMGCTDRVDTARTLFPLRGAGDVDRRSEDWMRVQHYRDFAAGRSFRMALLCHEAVELLPEASSAAVPTLHLATSHQADSDDLAPITRRAIKALGGEWPQAMDWPSLCAAIQAKGPDEELLKSEVLDLFVAGRFELRPRRLPFVNTVSERPLACPLARLQSEQNMHATNRRHESVHNDNYMRRTIALLDGTRDRAQIVAALVEQALDGKFDVKTEDGVPVDDPDDLAEAFGNTLPHRLGQLTEVGILIA